MIHNPDLHHPILAVWSYPTHRVHLTALTLRQEIAQFYHAQPLSVSVVSVKNRATSPEPFFVHHLKSCKYSYQFSILSFAHPNCTNLLSIHVFSFILVPYESHHLDESLHHSNTYFQQCAQPDLQILQVWLNVVETAPFVPKHLVHFAACL